MIKSKSVVKKLTTILFTLVAVFTIGLTNVNAKTTAEVNNYSDLTAKMNDNVTDVVKLTSDITLREDFDTTFYIEMSKTLDFNGFTLTVPEHHRFKLIYENSLDLKFINSNSSKRAKLNLLPNTGETPIYNEIMKAEYTVNFEMDGIDVEYIEDFKSFWQTAGDYRFNNVVFKNLKVTGFYEMVDTRAYESVKFSNVTKESKNANSKTYLVHSSTLTVDGVIDADSIIEYYDREGTKIANRTATLDTIDAYWGPITVKKKEVQTIMVTTEAELINAVNQINNSKDTIIKLGGSIKLTAPLDFYVLGNVTLDLAGNTLDVTENHLTFYYGYKDENNYNFRSNLTIKDSGNGNNGKIIGVGFNGRIRLSTLDMTEELKNLPKTYGLNIDGGTYAVTGTGSWDEYIFDVFSDSKPKEQNITLNVNVKKGVFEVGHVDGGIFLFTSSNNTNMKANFNFETLTVKGQGVKLGFNILGEKRFDDVVPSDTKIYYTDGNQVIELEDRTTLVTNVSASTDNSYPQYIKLVKEFGLSVGDIELSDVTYGYTDVPQTIINIANIGGENLEIKNISVDGSNFVVEGPSTAPTINIGETNTDYKIKATSNLKAGNYTATITITDNYNKTYTATVTLKVQPKQLTGLGIDLASTWVYKETKTPTLLGVEGLTPDDYAITYSKRDNSENYGNKMPILVGKYKATLSITNPNYTASEASGDFEITPITTEVKIKSYDETFTYDGTEHTKNAYDVLWANNASAVTDNKLPNGDIVTAVITGKVKDVKDTRLENNTIESYKIINSENVDVTNCYSKIVTSAGKLTVNPIAKSIVVTAGTSTKDYDGTPLTNNTYTYTEDVLLDGDVLKATVTGSQKFAGSSNNDVTSVKVMRGEEEITSNYTFGTHLNGMLTVMGASQPIMVADQSLIVNGFISLEDLKQKVTGNIGNIDITLKSGDALTYDAINEGYKAVKEGTVTMTVTAVKVNLGGDDTPEWIETSKDFKINVVNKENVTISGLNDNEEFTYDGTTKKPSGTIKVDGDKVPVNDLEVKYTGTSYDSAEAPKNAGTYMVTYKVKDENAKYVGSVTYTFTIKKAQLNKPTASTTSFVYDGTSKGYSSFHDSDVFEFTGTNSATNVGNYSLTISLKDKNNYEWKDEGTTTDVVINWSITQATPDYTVPTGLTGVKGNFLSSIELPYGFTWNNASELLTAGTHTYKATYTPEDTTNYKVIDNIDITVVVKNKFVLSGIVNGGNGTISVSSLEVLEGNKAEVVFTPDEGYMIDKVLVEGTEVEVTGNKLELTMDGNKLVTVSYKKIPFTITVKDVTGATVTPNGAVAVNYGEDKEFTITANSGYKLVKVLVDEVDKTADMVGDTLKLTNITSNINLEVVVEKIVYEVTEGANQEYIITKDSEAKFKINADFRLFDDGKVYVDNELVDPKNYTAESGSTIITLKKEYVDKLSIGKHTLKVVFSDGGQATTIFNVAKTTVPVENPNTLDNVMIYIVSGILSIIGITGAITFYKRKQKN